MNVETIPNDQDNGLKVLARIGQSLTSTLELDEVLRRIVEAGVRLTQAEEGFLALLDEENDQLFLRAVKNIDHTRSSTMRIPVSDSLIGQVIVTKQPLWIKQSDQAQPLKVSTGFLVRSLLHVPILSKGRVLGVLSMDNQAMRRDFTEMHVDLLTSLADYASIAIENASLYEQAQQEIQERTRVENALRESEKRYELAVRGANDGLWDWDLQANKIYFSPRWKSMLGYPDDEVGDCPDEWFSRIHPEELERFQLEVSAHLKGVTSHCEIEFRMQHKDGSYRWMLCRGLAVWEGNRGATRIAGSLTDITDRKSAEDKLFFDAFHDALTGLPNRALFLDRLALAIERAKRREDYLFAVLFLDLDRFKDVNDSLGHLMGDRLLVAIAERLQKGLRTTDSVARLGGDEFVILIEDIVDFQGATRVAQWIHEQLAEPYEMFENDVLVTTSIGIVFNSQEYNSPEDMLRDADIAMYYAKANGKARYEIFDPVMRSRIMERLALESELRQAISRGELAVYYQPIVSLDQGKLMGFEALVRWKNPSRGLLRPADFIHLAEDTGMIVDVDRWVLKTACQQMSAWKQDYAEALPLTLSVNMSGKYITQPDLIPTIAQILEETGLNPENLKLEITENAIIENNLATREAFAGLQSLGIQIQIDDFGIGYSSLGYLSQFPVNALKIDQSFVSKMDSDSSHMKIVQAIVSLTHRLGVGVIAEGLETSSQLEKLRALNCGYGQGYLISEPLDRESAQFLLRELFALHSEASFDRPDVNVRARVQSPAG
jgi:diguanylate cyclase (GGDEF)-like protein/PAS domain S-box-containing protein